MVKVLSKVNASLSIWKLVVLLVSSLIYFILLLQYLAICNLHHVLNILALPSFYFLLEHKKFRGHCQLLSKTLSTSVWKQNGFQYYYFVIEDTMLIFLNQYSHVCLSNIDVYKVRIQSFPSFNGEIVFGERASGMECFHFVSEFFVMILMWKQYIDKKKKLIADPTQLG